MWTGVYPHKHNVIENIYGTANAIEEISSVKTTVFDCLRGSGYVTAYFGKWHLGESDPGMFDVWDGFNSQGGHWVNGVQGGRYIPDIQTDHCIDFLKGQANADKPFFMVQGYYPPHNPFTAPKEYMDYYRQKRSPFPGYYAAVSALDANVGRVMKTLEETRLADKTIVIYYSDHGETFNYRNESFHKFVCYEESTHVPFVLRWPGKVQGGGTVEAFIGLEDLMPSILDWADVAPPHELDGRSIEPLLRDRESPWRDAYYIENITHANHYPQRCLREKEWKLILSDGQPNELYNLMSDPEEELNIYETPRKDVHNQYAHLPSYAGIIRGLAQRMEARALEVNDDVGMSLVRQALDDLARRD
jgi:choline-sulfatase